MNRQDIIKSAKDKLDSRLKAVRVNCKRDGKYGRLAGFAYIEPEDYDKVKDYSWNFYDGYVRTLINGNPVRMHVSPIQSLINFSTSLLITIDFINAFALN